MRGLRAESMVVPEEMYRLHESIALSLNDKRASSLVVGQPIHKKLKSNMQVSNPITAGQVSLNEDYSPAKKWQTRQFEEKP